jgi:hypothetical protein
LSSWDVVIPRTNRSQRLGTTHTMITIFQSYDRIVTSVLPCKLCCESV